MRNRKQQGFTLIELLIVIAIIGILAAVLIPNLLNARQRALDTAAQACLKEIATAEEIYFIDYDEYDYDASIADSIAACNQVTVNVSGGSTSAYGYTGVHSTGGTTFFVSPSTGVQ